MKDTTINPDEVEAAARAYWEASADLRSKNPALAAIAGWEGLPEFYTDRQKAYMAAALEAALQVVHAEVERLTAELAALKEHALNSNPALRTLHANAVAYLKAVEAYTNKTGGGPFSTSFEWLIRVGYLVPATPDVLQSDAYSKGELRARVTFEPVDAES